MKNKNKPRHYIGKDGLETWRLNGQFHRDDGPALIQHGSKFWYKYNKLSIEERHNFTKWPWHEKLRKSFMI